ncbi:MAG TPA: hypothetical protein DD618_02095 [Acholeplasmatales bacterium]|nr:hypothetical protein [Acholeplasmatales bacterium]
MKSKITDTLKTIFLIFFVAIFVIALLYELFPNTFPKWMFWTIFTVQGAVILGLVTCNFIYRFRKKPNKPYKIEKWSYGKTNPFRAFAKVPKEWIDSFTEEEWAYVERMGRNGPEAIYEILERKGYFVEKFRKEFEKVNELME